MKQHWQSIANAVSFCHFERRRGVRSKACPEKTKGKQSREHCPLSLTFTTVIGFCFAGLLTGTALITCVIQCAAP
jgi:hypothetical protein